MVHVERGHALCESRCDGCATRVCAHMHYAWCCLQVIGQCVLVWLLLLNVAAAPARCAAAEGLKLLPAFTNSACMQHSTRSAAAVRGTLACEAARSNLHRPNAHTRQHQRRAADTCMKQTLVVFAIGGQGAAARCSATAVLLIAERGKPLRQRCSRRAARSPVPPGWLWGMMAGASGC